jgi:hypothetical protein
MTRYCHLADAGAWVLDTGATNHMFGCPTAFMKLDMTVRCTVHFSDDLMAWIEGRGTVIFMCKNGESQSLEGVYFFPRLAINIVSIGQLYEVGYKIDINTCVIKIWVPIGLQLTRVKREANCLYLLHIKLM